MRYKVIFCLSLLVGSLLTTPAKAQDVNQTATETVKVNSAADDLFQKLMPKKDTTYSSMAKPKDTKSKRFSLHTNIVDWLTTVPNLGIEYDLKKNEKNNRSLLLFGKFNGGTKHSISPSFNFNVAAVRVEFRKYWRTGKEGKALDYYENFKKLNLHKPDTTWVTDSVYEEGEWKYSKRATFDPHNDSIRAAYNGNPYKSELYNRYQQLRRILSGRTIENPRNWRAYYLGAFAGFDKYNLCFGENGKQGTGFAFGATLGWSIPLLTQTFPKEGGLDLDLGLNIGAKFVKYDAYTVHNYYTSFDNQYTEYVRNDAKSKDKWTIVPFPVVQDVHVSLVYRFRSISRKVSLALVDEYEKNILDFEQNIKNREDELLVAKARAEAMRDSINKANKAASDSTAFADYFNKRRIQNMLMMDPDTTHLSSEDSIMYIKYILEKDPATYVTPKPAKVKKSKKAKDSGDAATDSLVEVPVAIETEAVRAARAAVSQSDSTLLAARAALKALEEMPEEADSTLDKATLKKMAQERKDAIAAAKKAEKDAENAVKKAKNQAELTAKQAEKDAAAEAKKAAAEAKKAAKAAEAEAKKAGKTKKDDTALEEENVTEEKVEEKVAEAVEIIDKKAAAAAKKAEAAAKKEADAAAKKAAAEAKKAEATAKKEAAAAEKKAAAEAKKAEAEAKKVAKAAEKNSSEENN